MYWISAGCLLFYPPEVFFVSLDVAVFFESSEGFYDCVFVER